MVPIGILKPFRRRVRRGLPVILAALAPARAAARLLSGQRCVGGPAGYYSLPRRWPSPALIVRRHARRAHRSCTGSISGDVQGARRVVADATDRRADRPRWLAGGG